VKKVDIGYYTASFCEDRLVFEHNTTGEDGGICFYLEDKSIYDYDGAYCIPNRVGQWLKENGYNVFLDFDGMWEIL
jgi:hypothetical protein